MGRYRPSTHVCVTGSCRKRADSGREDPPIATEERALREGRQETALVREPSDDPFSDTPATVSQDRELRNVGAKVDLTYTAGNHNVKVGGTLSATKLTENF